MPATALAEKVILVALEAVALYCLSRILFVWVLQALATRQTGGGWLIKVLRLPGNLVHEISHATGYLLCGYRVKRLVLCISDPKGRGACKPGRAWCPIAFPWLATASAAVLPLIIGALSLRGIAVMLDIPFTNGPGAPGDGPLLVLWDGVRATLRAMDYHDWRTYLFLYFGFSIGAELAPSQTDLRRSVIPVLGIAIGLACATYYLGHLHADSRAWEVFAGALSRGLRWMSSLLAFGILATALLAAVTVIPALVWRAARRL